MTTLESIVVAPGPSRAITTNAAGGIGESSWRAKRAEKFLSLVSVWITEATSLERAHHCAHRAHKRGPGETVLTRASEKGPEGSFRRGSFTGPPKRALKGAFVEGPSEGSSSSNHPRTPEIDLMGAFALVEGPPEWKGPTKGPFGEKSQPRTLFRTLVELKGPTNGLKGGFGKEPF